MNRRTRTALPFLELDLAKPGETPELRGRFEAILEAHDVGIDAAEPA